MALEQSRLTPAKRGHAAMLLFSMLIAGSFSLGSLAANEIEPAALNTIRFFFAACLIGVVGLATKSLDRRIMQAPWRSVILGVLFATYFVLMFEGLKTATPVSTAAVFTLTPIIAAGFGWLLMRQMLTKRMALALVIGGIGAVWVIFRADIEALLAFRIGTGEMIFFWGVVSHALYTPMARRLNRSESPIAMTFGMLIAGFFVLLAYGWTDIWATDWTNLPTIVWITIGYTSVFAGATTFTLIQYSVLRLPAAKVMAYTYLTPSWVILWEMALGHGVPSGLILAGVALTIVALWMLLKDE